MSCSRLFFCLYFFSVEGSDQEEAVFLSSASASNSIRMGDAVHAATVVVLGRCPTVSCPVLATVPSVIIKHCLLNPSTFS